MTSRLPGDKSTACDRSWSSRAVLISQKDRVFVGFALAPPMAHNFTGFKECLDVANETVPRVSVTPARASKQISDVLSAFADNIIGGRLRHGQERSSFPPRHTTRKELISTIVFLSISLHDV